MRDRRRDRGYRVLARVLAVLLVPVAVVRAPGRPRFVACQWALAARFPAEDLTGLTPKTKAAFLAARAVAFWRDGELIGLTSGYRDALTQHRLHAADRRRGGGRALPADQSRHVLGTALDVRPVAGARWLERHGARWHLYRVYDNEWWHFEYWPDDRPPRHARPGAAAPTVVPWPTPDTA